MIKSYDDVCTIQRMMVKAMNAVFLARRFPTSCEITTYFFQGAYSTTALVDVHVCCLLSLG
jgi:hypothetical protein